MLRFKIKCDGAIATVSMQDVSVIAPRGLNVERAMTLLDDPNIRGIIFDATGLKTLSNATLAGVIEMFLRLDRGRLFRAFPLALALVSVPKKTMAQIVSRGLDRVLPLYDDSAAALADPRFQAVQLCGMQSVLLCADAAPQMAPITRDQPIGLLDYLGAPIAARVLDHAARFGLRDFILNPGHMGGKMTAFAQRQTTASLFCVNESVWQHGSTSNVATLAHLHAAHSVLETETFVFQSNVVSDLDLAAMRAFHRATNADATVAVAQNGFASAWDQDKIAPAERASAILLSPRTVQVFGRNTNGLGEKHIVSALRNAGMNVQFFATDHQSTSINCGADYFNSLAQTLSTGAMGIVPKGEQIGPKTWVAKEGQINRGAVIEGACFVGQQARIGRGSVLRGTNVIGKGAVVEKNAILSNSVLMPFTDVQPKTYVDHMIADAEWAVNHRFANGSVQNRAPLDGVQSVNGVAPLTKIPPQPVPNIA